MSELLWSLGPRHKKTQLKGSWAAEQLPLRHSCRAWGLLLRSTSGNQAVQTHAAGPGLLRNAPEAPQESLSELLCSPQGHIISSMPAVQVLDC